MSHFMSYLNEINTLLKPNIGELPLVLDLFAGCGGLALGFEAHGFKTLGYEMDMDCCATYNHNLIGECVNVKLSSDFAFPKAKVVIGGPPCQPFSVGGSQKGIEDSRDGFPIFISAIEQADPDIWMFENVRGLMYKNKWYLEEVINKLEQMNYVIEYDLFNAVNFAVPQNRERIIVVGHRGQFKFPEKPFKNYTVQDAIGDTMGAIPKDAKFLTPSMDAYVKKYEDASKCINPRDLYPDKPSRTLTCRNLAGATGDMQRVKLDDGRRRRLTVREAARIQSFPDWYYFKGEDHSAFNQIGNSVAPMFSYHMAQSVKNYFDSNRQLEISEILKLRRPSQLTLPMSMYGN